MLRQFTFDRTRVDRSNVKANLVDGVLAIAIPKKVQLKLELLAVAVKVGCIPEETGKGESPSKKDDHVDC